MNYYQHNIGDYAQATMHLSILEDGAYSRLIRRYYAEEKPLPADIAAVQRLVGARSKDEREAVEVVLREFFTLQADGWHQSRCDQEIAAYREKACQARANGRLGGRPKHPARRVTETNPVISATDPVISGFQDGTDGEPEANPEKTGSKANQEPITNNQEPITKNQETEEKKKPKAKAPDGALAALPPWMPIDAWNGFMEMRTKIRKPATKRAQELLIQKLIQLRASGHDPAEVLDQSTRNDWQDVYPIKPDVRANGAIGLPVNRQQLIEASNRAAGEEWLRQTTGEPNA